MGGLRARLEQARMVQRPFHAKQMARLPPHKADEWAFQDHGSKARCGLPCHGGQSPWGLRRNTPISLKAIVK